MRCQRHLGGRFKFSLNGSTGATFFLGVSEPRLNINTSALLFFVPIRAANHTHISGGSLLYQVGLVRRISVLFFVTLFRPSCFSGLISLLLKRLASPASSQRHNKSLNTGLAIPDTQPLLIQLRLQPAG